MENRYSTNAKGFFILFLLLPFFSFGSAKEKQAFKIENGVNISHWLSQSAARGEKRAQYFTRDDVKFIRSLGFDHIRIPIDEEQMFREDGEKEQEAFFLLHHAIEWCREFDLHVVVDLHILRSHYFNSQEKPLFTDEKAQESFYECWRQLSRELKKYPNSMVAYELMNEPVADDPEVWNMIANRCAAVIRELEPERTLIIGSNRWQGYETVKDLRVPENDPHIIISFHYYNPFLLTHYKASWTDIKDYNGPVHYPGALIAADDLTGLPESLSKKYQWWSTRIYDIHKIESDFKEVLAVAGSKGLKVYCGEYGCISAAPAEDKYRWFTDMSTLFKRYGIARAVWDYKGGFGIVEKGSPQWPVIEALTGTKMKE
ncbi:MAG: glycoside hydrolase family 5 protein [Bacteroidales bacterium]|jgi:endoglucanase|nr:glycoside hydrolase family 5 protein [Bacteroidales bacterium]